MKNSRLIKTIVPLLFVSLFIFSCNDQEEKKADAKDSTVTKKDTTTTPEPAHKKGTATQWNANASVAQIKFSVSGPFGVVHGSLSGLKANIQFDKDDLAGSSISAGVDANSIATGIKLRNSDLKKEKYLDTDKYPSISFRSDKIERSGTGYKAVGKLTIKGTSRAQEIPFSFSENGNGGVFKGQFTIERSNYGVGSSGGSIGSTITVDLEVPVTK